MGAIPESRPAMKVQCAQSDPLGLGQGRFERILGGASLWSVWEIRWVSVEGMGERHDREVAGFDDGACLDVPDGGDSHSGSGSELFLAEARMLAACAQPGRQAHGLLRIAAVSAASASPSDHSVSVLKIYR